MKTEPVFLRALDKDDIVRTLQWHNDSTLYESLGGVFRFVSRTAEEEWLRQKCTLASNELSLAICLRKTRRHVGNIYLRNIDWIARHGEMHMFIGESGQRRHGYGLPALRQLVDHAFRTMGLQRMYLFVMADNAAAVTTYRKCGFVVEGRMKRHAFKSGAFKDVLVMGVCAEAEG